MTQQIPEDIAKDSLVPIIVGITGHIKLTGATGDIIITEDKISDDQKNEIKKVFEELDRNYPNTPIVILSPLAEGADRMVAHLALDTKRKKEASISLICPLPMEKEEYEKDFENQSKGEFEDLLKRSSAWFELPLIENNSGESIEDKNKEGEPRKKQYEQAGKYIAQHSHILIALWDGEDHEGVDGLGGTSQIVKMRHEGTISPRRPLDEIDNVPIYHFSIAVKENNNGKEWIDVQPRREIFPGMNLHPGKETTPEEEAAIKQKTESFHRVLDRMEMFNGDVKSLSAKRRKKIKENKLRVIPGEKDADLTVISRRILHHYAVADTLAMRFQRWSDKALFWLFIIVLAALTCFELYAHLELSCWFLLGYPVGLAIGLFIYLYASLYRDVQSKYLDYRALAEGLRVQFFWILSGDDKEVIEFYLRKQQSELDWIKYAVRSFNMPFSNEEFREKEKMKETPDTQLLSKRMKCVVLPNWIGVQADYFIEKTSKLGGKLKWQHRFGRSFFFFGVGTSIILFILHFSIEYYPSGRERDIFIVAIGMALAIAAAFGGYTEKKAISAQAKRYAWMSGIFKRAKTELGKALKEDNFEEARKLISELGKEALEENADWLIIRRERKIEVPTG